jgi:hypothetical protein
MGGYLVLKKTITYTDFNGDEVKEDFFFHLSKAELVELEMSHDGGLSAAMQRIVETDDRGAIISEFKKIILLSYGKKSMDGKRFIKNATMREEFESSEAYSTLFMELVTVTEAAVDFMNGIIPAGFAEEAAETVTPTVEPKRITEKEAREYQDMKELTNKIVSGEIVIVDE